MTFEFRLASLPDDEEVILDLLLLQLERESLQQTAKSIKVTHITAC